MKPLPTDDDPRSVAPDLSSMGSDPGPEIRDAAGAALRERFGHPDFRPGQRPIVEAMLAGRDVLAVLPTGAGKSICFQLPALLSPRPVIVVSPLIALMHDQVAALCGNGIDAAALTSTSSEPERRRMLARLVAGGPFLLYVTPERLASKPFVQVARRARPGRIVVDEAHCISEWGHDFRPEYRRIGRFGAAIGRPPVAAFTATATPATRADIARQLELRRPADFAAPVDRPNLRWAVRRAGSMASAVTLVGEALGACENGAGLVYVPTRALAAGCAAALRRVGITALAYHAGLDDVRRSRAQGAWLNADDSVICATSAFGMGIDHPRVRLVAHLGMPGALEAYVQEAGRAGRDGEPSRCLLLTLPGGARLHRARLRELNRSGRVAGHRRLTAMRGYVIERRCRRRAIAAYFGEDAPRCAGCDLCDARAEGRQVRPRAKLPDGHARP
ncbi:MAG: RecQ family ATP-dependent DNA helicase [Gemmatimonadota bacterium]